MKDVKGTSMNIRDKLPTDIATQKELKICRKKKMVLFLSVGSGASPE